MQRNIETHKSRLFCASVFCCASALGDDEEEGAADDDDEAGGWGTKKKSKKAELAVDAGAALYAKMKATKAEAKDLRKSVYEPLVLPANWKTMSEDDRRAVSRQIKANRGLVRSRPKDRKNPKTANRLRYEKRLVARSGAVQLYKGSQEANYGGQATGIKTTLTKSISLRS
jgi:U3 small nucleolar RNA-associated protein 3